MLSVLALGKWLEIARNLSASERNAKPKQKMYRGVKDKYMLESERNEDRLKH